MQQTKVYTNWLKLFNKFEEILCFCSLSYDCRLLLGLLFLGFWLLLLIFICRLLLSLFFLKFLLSLLPLFLSSNLIFGKLTLRISRIVCHPIVPVRIHDLRLFHLVLVLDAGLWKFSALFPMSVIPCYFIDRRDILSSSLQFQDEGPEIIDRGFAIYLVESISQVCVTMSHKSAVHKFVEVSS